MRGELHPDEDGNASYVAGKIKLFFMTIIFGRME